MSVTFSAEITATADLRVFAVTCSTGEKLGDYTGYEAAYSEAQAHGLVCTDSLCQDYGADVDEVETDATPAGVNMANRNAADVLRAVGLLGSIDDEMYGEIDAAELITLIDAALIVGVNDAPLDEIATQGCAVLGASFEGTSIDARRAAGYVSGRLGEIRALAVKCLAQGVRVVWS